MILREKNDGLNLNDISFPEKEIETRERQKQGGSISREREKRKELKKYERN